MSPIAGVIASSISGHLTTGSFYQIQQLSPSAVSTVTFSSIPSTYKSLQVRFNLIVSTNTIFKVQFNGDTGSNYAFHNLVGSGTATSANGGGANQAFIYINQNSTYITYPEVGIIDIIDYANTNKYKTLKSITGINNNTSAGTIELDSGLWMNTAAITSLTLLVPNGTYTGTITLYGSN